MIGRLPDRKASFIAKKLVLCKSTQHEPSAFELGRVFRSLSREREGNPEFDDHREFHACARLEMTVMPVNVREAA